MASGQDADPHNVHERLWQAVHSLVTGTGSLQERLDHARHNLIPLQPSEFPSEEMKRAFAQLEMDLDRAHAGEMEPNGPAEAVMALYSGIVARGGGWYGDDFFADHFGDSTE
jgi:hypothetical protein